MVYEGLFFYSVVWGELPKKRKRRGNEMRVEEGGNFTVLASLLRESEVK